VSLFYCWLQAFIWSTSIRPRSLTRTHHLRRLFALHSLPVRIVWPLPTAAFAFNRIRVINQFVDFCFAFFERSLRFEKRSIFNKFGSFTFRIARFSIDNQWNLFARALFHRPRFVVQYVWASIFDSFYFSLLNASSLISFFFFVSIQFLLTAFAVIDGTSRRNLCRHQRCECVGVQLVPE
jgi:hypothetical protein